MQKLGKEIGAQAITAVINHLFPRDELEGDNLGPLKYTQILFIHISRYKLTAFYFLKWSVLHTLSAERKLFGIE